MKGEGWGVDLETWTDWQWQQRNIVRSANRLKELLPALPADELAGLREYENEHRWSVTPHVLSLMHRSSDGLPSRDDPLVRQFLPMRGFTIDDALDSRDGEHVNWELPEEMPTSIMQHKYPSKVIIRTRDDCFGYCGFCFEVERVLRKDTQKGRTPWQESVDYIREHTVIEEVVLSGGDPLMMSNTVLKERLAELDAINHVRLLRLHTRALTFNPYRIDDEVAETLSTYISALGIHVAHPQEIQEGFVDAVNRLRQHDQQGTVYLGNIPLLAGINDDPDVLRELFFRLGEVSIKPYYLYHDLPWSPAADTYRTTVTKGVELMREMKRVLPNWLLPEFVLVHHTGKHTVPLEPDGTPEFQYNPGQIKFKNWKGNWETYLDR